MALRDASWFNRPNTRSVKQYHAIGATPMVAACCPWLPLADFTAQDVAEVPVTLRCRRAACKKLWKGSDG